MVMTPERKRELQGDVMRMLNELKEKYGTELLPAIPRPRLEEIRMSIERTDVDAARPGTAGTLGTAGTFGGTAGTFGTAGTYGCSD
jgi:hypothetical protein